MADDFDSFMAAQPQDVRDAVERRFRELRAEYAAPTPRLVPDRPSDAAIAQAVREIAGLITAEAFEYPTANTHTPQIVALCQRLERLSREIDRGLSPPAYDGSHVGIEDRADLWPAWVHRVVEAARIDAAAPPAEAPAERGEGES